MKIILIALVIVFSYNNYLMSAENNKCTNIKKLSKEYTACKVNLINTKISNTVVAKKIKKFSEKKTIFNLFKKN